MASFQDILSKPMNEIEPPKALPTGTYLCIVDGQPEIAQKGKNQNWCVTFTLRPVQAQQDVDPSALADTLKGATLSDKRLRHMLWVTDDAVWRLKQFLTDHLGIEASNVQEAIPMSMGKQVYVTIGHRPSEDGSQIFADIKATAKV